MPNLGVPLEKVFFFLVVLFLLPRAAIIQHRIAIPTGDLAKSNTEEKP